MTGSASPQMAAALPHSTINDQNPWPGLAAFDESAERFFNGRRKEAAELRRLVLYGPLTVVFGASGLGKSSLLQAGLFPLLRRENILPIYVRLDVRDKSAPLIDQVRNKMAAEFQSQHVDAPAPGPGESLWEWLHRDELQLWSARNQRLTPLFVFDQFEEVFTLGGDNADAITRLRIDLSDLVENRIPAGVAVRIQASEGSDPGLDFSSHRYKVLLSFREDFLPQVEGWKQSLPSIMRNRLRLLPMSTEQAFEAVHLTAPALADEKVAREIVRFVAAAQEERSASAADAADADLSVEPALLSLVCHGLNERRKSQGKPSFDLDLLRGTGQTIVRDFYEKSLRDLPERVQRFIEDELITERGFRKQCDVDDARSVHGVTAQELRLLVDRRLLRIEPRRRTEIVELTHDLLTRVVREYREERREKARFRARKRRIILFSATAAGIILLGFLAFSAYIVSTRNEALREKEAAIEEKNKALDEVEQRRVAIEKLIAEKQEELSRLSNSVRGGTNSTAVREVIASTQRTLNATKTGIEEDRITPLVRQLNDREDKVRLSAGGALARSHSANPVAISLVLDSLSPQNIELLSAQGRINALYFLSRSDSRAWTESDKRTAQEMIARLRARSARGIAPLGAQTAAELDNLEKKVRP